MNVAIRRPGRSRTLAGLAVTLFLALAAPGDHASAADPAAVHAGPSRTPRHGARLRAALERQRAELEPLRARLDRTERSGRPAVQREIETAKRVHAAELLALQAERARSLGHAATAERLELRRAALLSGGGVPATPAAPATPAERGAR